jgi:hypothetical protein
MSGNYNCACGATAYRCKECNNMWCSQWSCNRGNSKPANSGAINCCPRCGSHNSTEYKD